MSGTTTEQHPDPAAQAAAPVPVVRRQATTDIALVATFAAFIAVCSILPGIPGPGGVPFTLQTFAVVLAGLVLGARRGAAAVALYLVVGCAGVPVFADHAAGLAVLTGPTGGYLVGFVLGAAVVGSLLGPALRLADRVPTGSGARASAWRGTWRFLATTVVGLVGSAVVLASGAVGLMWRAGMSFHQTNAINAVFVPGELIKTALAALVTLTVFRAFPDLARTRR